MKSTATISEALELKVDTDKVILQNPEVTGQRQYQDLVILLAELEAEGYFAELDVATQDRDELPSDPEEETFGQEKYEAFVAFLAELEAEGCLSELDAATLGQPRAQSWLEHQVTKLIQPIAAMRTKPIACFDRHTTLTAKVACTLS
ncbi:MAG: hypothetical protein HC770_03015 [Pseudanabaena sp. CRU_2_10]|nr:hypothetical protein [Pseudanabaena sp. CRU_2_10]